MYIGWLDSILGIGLLFNKLICILHRIYRKQPKMDVLSTSAAYWQNWRVFLCFLSLLTTISMASYVNKKYEGPKEPRSTREQEQDEEDDIGVVFEHQLWKTCWREIHPAWLLGYRMFSFFTLLFILIADVIIFGGQVFFYYTEYVFFSSIHSVFFIATFKKSFH